MSNDMIDRVAHAICPHIRQKACLNCPSQVETEYGKGTQLCRLQAREFARTAIAAMRNPTDEMVAACQRALVDTMRDLGWSKAQRAGRLTSQTKAVMRWNAMIDCAIK